jgi:hypothetical protein
LLQQCVITIAIVTRGKPMQNPTDTIREVHEHIKVAIEDFGSINAFMGYMGGNTYFKNRQHWGTLTYPTVRKIYRWRPNNRSGNQFMIDTLYALYLMAQDYHDHKRGD